MSFDAAGTRAHGELPTDLRAIGQSVSTLRFSSHGYTSRGADTPSYTHYQGRLRSARFEQQIALGTGFSARLSLAFGELALWNGDNALNSLFSDYAIDGRACTMRAANAAGAGIAQWPALSSFMSVFAGTSARWRRTRDSLIVSTRGVAHKLDIPLQQVFFDGSGGLEGGTEHAGKPKPVWFGPNFNVPPVYMGVTDLGLGALHTYLLHGRAIAAVYAVKVRGLPMTRVSGVPGLAQYWADETQAVVQLGFSPPGAVTVDFAGDAVGGYVASAPRVVRRIWTDYLGQSESDLDLMAFNQLDYDCPGDINWGSNGTVTATTAVEQILGGVLAYPYQTRAGKFAVAALKPPGTTPAFTLGEADIIAIEPVDLPTEIDPPIKRASVGYRNNWSPSDDLSEDVAQDERAALISQFLVTAALNSTIAQQHALAQELPPFASSYARKPDGDALAARLIALYGQRRAFRIEQDRYMGTIEPGMTGQIHWPYDGIGNGWKAIVIGITEDWIVGRTTLIVFG